MPINLNPDPELLNVWGDLAYVDESERNQILNAPFGQFKSMKKKLAKEIKDAKKEAEKKRKR